MDMALQNAWTFIANKMDSLSLLLQGMTVVLQDKLRMFIVQSKRVKKSFRKSNHTAGSRLADHLTSHVIYKCSYIFQSVQKKPRGIKIKARKTGLSIQTHQLSKSIRRNRRSWVPPHSLQCKTALLHSTTVITGTIAKQVTCKCAWFSPFLCMQSSQNSATPEFSLNCETKRRSCCYRKCRSWSPIRLMKHELWDTVTQCSVVTRQKDANVKGEWLKGWGVKDAQKVKSQGV